mgnify:FL=1
MKKISLRKIFSFKWFLIIALVFFVLFIYSKLGPNNWSVVMMVDKPQIEKGWSDPKGVGINTGQWEDGAFISGDGSTLFYAYYPGDLINDLSIGKLKDDIDVYYSEKPFNGGKKHALSEDKWSEGGVMMSGGDIYYMSNRNRLETDDLYKNGQIIFDTLNKSEQDPHYCATKDELYFDAEGIIYVYKKNKSTALPSPINDGSRNIQPFLTPDCEQIYFASSRGDGVSKILRSNRILEDSWGEPELIVKSKYGVGEPTLTDNGKTMFFVQIFKSAKEVMNSDIFYVEKTAK